MSDTDKISELRNECLNTDYDIRFVAETCFDDQLDIVIDGYDYFRRESKSGGGVCIYRRNQGSLSSGEPNMTNLTREVTNKFSALLILVKSPFFLGCN